MRILIIDDDKLISWVLEQICIQEGHDVIVVSDADGAFKTLEAQPPDMIFADLDTESIDMPDLAKQLQLRQLKTSLIFLSSQPRKEMKSLLGDLNVRGTIGKPFEASAVRSFIQNLQVPKGEGRRPFLD